MAQEVDPVKTARLFEFYVGHVWPLQRRFVADAAHQLRTPVAGIRVLAQELGGRDISVNAVAPDTQPQAAFVQALAASFGCTVWMRVPDAPMRWALGEMATLLLDGQNARPRAAVGAGYRFAYPKLQTALQSMADPARATPAAPVVAADLR